MPIYEYVCKSCGRLTEVIQKLGDPPPSPCPGCGAEELEKLISRTSFQLKGGGWYADLYSSSTKKKADGTSTPPAEAKPTAAKPEKAEGSATKGAGEKGT